MVSPDHIAEYSLSVFITNCKKCLALVKCEPQAIDFTAAVTLDTQQGTATYLMEDIELVTITRLIVSLLLAAASMTEQVPSTAASTSF